MFQRSVIRIDLRSDSPRLRDVVGEPNRRREIEVGESCPRVIEDRVYDEIELTQMPAEYRSYLRSGPIGVPMLGVVAELEIDAVEKGLFCRMRHDEEFAYLEPIQHGSLAIGHTVKRQVQALLKPVGNAVGPLRNAVERLIGDKPARETGRLQPFRGKVVMDHQIEDARLCDLRVIDLYLVGLG